ncbi:MAG: YfhO family protein [Clostridiales bacterium]|nr:YfhO family protein [Clostridiales bacterium]
MENQLTSKAGFWKRSWCCFAAFLLPALIMGLVYALFGMYPFGEKSLLITDMGQQYVDYHTAFYDILKNGDSIFYTWNTGGGMNFYGLIAYYLASPFVLLILLFPKWMITEALLLITLLKLGSAGLAFSLYAKKAHSLTGALNAAFSVMYALMSYAVVYTFNIMWLDGVILLPLVALSIHHLLKKGKILPLCVSLFFLFITNYYIAYMVGIFSFLYFLIQYFRTGRFHEKKDFGRVLGKFMGAALLAALCAAVMLLPALLTLLNGYKGLSGFRITPSLYFKNPLELASMAFPGSYDSLTNGLPNIFCSVLTLILLPLFFLNRKIERREKKWCLAVLLLMIVSFMSVMLNLAWHVFQTPNWFPYRYSFVFSFLLLYMAIRAIQNLDGISKKAAPIAGCAVMVTALLSACVKPEVAGTSVLMMTGACVCCYTLCLMTYRNVQTKRLLSGAAAVLILFAAGVETFSNANQLVQSLDNQFHYDNREDYVGYMQGLEEAVQAVEQYDSGFYRMETHNMRKPNDDMDTGYHGLIHYSSVSNQFFFEFLGDLGMLSIVNDRQMQYLGATSVVDSLMGIRYTLGGDNRAGYTPVAGLEQYAVSRNENALAMAWLADVNAADYKAVETDPFTAQNDLLNAISGENVPYYTPVDYQVKSMGLTLTPNGEGYRITDGKDGKVTLSFTNEKEQEIYFSLNSNISRYTEVHLNGKRISGKEHWLETIVNLGTFKAGETVTLEFFIRDDQAKINSIHFATFDESAFSNFISNCREGEIQDITVTDTTLSGHIETDKEALLMTSIPFDPGWSVKINGQKAEVVSIDSALTAVRLPSAGSYTVEFSYTPPGFIVGAMLSGIGVILLILCVWFCDFRKKRNR